MSAITLAFLGDVMLGRGVNESIGRRDPDLFWGDVLPVLNDADAVIANLECAITSHQQPWTHTHKVFHFGAKPQSIDVLKAANIHCVNLANNHILDFDYAGLFDTLNYLDDAGIHHTGAGRNVHDAREPAIFNVRDVRIGVIGMTDNEPPFAAGEQRGGTLYTNFQQLPEALAQLDALLDSARTQGAALIVLSLHWGPNMVARPPEAFQTFAREAVDRGVHLIHGHSAHLFQGIEVYNDGVILYDTGDFLDDYAVHADLRNDWSFVFLAEIDSTRVTRMRLIPVKLTYAQVNHARGEEFDAIRKTMADRCHGFDIPLRETEEGLELAIASEMSSD